jgi:ABC-type glycerol-3-phosphate transport system substrate-binding protein
MSHGRTEVTRRRFLGGALGAAAAVPAVARRAGAQAKPTITYWNGLTGADGKVMDGLIEQFTNETGIKVEQQRIIWADLYAKLQVSVPAGEGPDLVLIHTVEVPHFADDGILEPMADATVGAKGFRGEDYIPSTWQGATFQGKRYAIPLDVPQHLFYMNVKVMKDAGLVGADGKPKVPGSKDELLAMAKQIAKGDTFGFAIGTVNPGKYTWGFHNLLWQNGANVYGPDLKRSALTEPAAIEAAELWASSTPSTRWRRPRTRAAATPSSRGSWGCGSRDPGTSPACGTPRWTSLRRRCPGSSSSPPCGPSPTCSHSRSPRRPMPPSGTPPGPIFAG